MYIIKEAITKNTIDSMRKEAQLFNKAIKKISTPFDLYEVGKAMYDYSIRLLDYRDEVIHSRYDSETRYQNFNFSNLRDFIHYCQDCLQPYKILKTKAYYDWKEYDERLFQGALVSFEKRRTSLYTTFSQKLKKAFDNLDYWITSIGNIAPERAKKEFIKYKGIKITLIKDEAYSDEFVKYSITDLMKDIDKINKDLSIKRISNRFFQNSTIEYYNSISLSVGGEYNPRTNTITVLATSDDSYYTLVHEIGHCFWYTALTEKSRKEWSNFSNDPKNYFYIDDAIKSSIKNILISIYKESDVINLIDSITNEYDNIIDKEDKIKLGHFIYNKVVKLPDQKDKAVFSLRMFLENRNFSNFYFLPTKQVNSKNFNSSLDFFMGLFEDSRTKGGLLYNDKIMLDKLSLYSSQNKEEAFAETFAYYIFDYHKKFNFSEEFVRFFNSILRGI